MSVKFVKALIPVLHSPVNIFRGMQLACKVTRSVTGVYNKTGLLQALNLVKKDSHRTVPVQNFHMGHIIHII